MKAVMKMLKKVNMQHVLIVVLLLAVVFGCKCAMKGLGVEGFEEVPQGFDGERVVFALASWCGHCKSLKSSGEIDKLKEDPEVPVEINEDDEEANKKYGVNGFPTILKVNGDGEQVPFKGPRTAEAIKEFFKKE
tara:strand:+ start:2440 stop:2841 length:402 start_codon:yes stop_codon:yes gene_type:complete